MSQRSSPVKFHVDGIDSPAEVGSGLRFATIVHSGFWATIQPGDDFGVPIALNYSDNDSQTD
jgi:hypothetical protein